MKIKLPTKRQVITFVKEHETLVLGVVFGVLGLAIDVAMSRQSNKDNIIHVHVDLDR